MALSPVTLGMVGLAFSLWGNALANFGFDTKPIDEDGPDPTKTVAAAASLTGAVTLLFTSTFLVIAAPLGSDGPVVQLQLLFSAITGMYGLQFLATTIVQFKGYDPRPLGNFALLTVPIQIVEMVLLAHYASAAGMSGTHIALQEATLGAFAVAGLAIWAGTHGRVTGRVVGSTIMGALVGTLYFMFFAGGLIPAPA
ncbi:hypothetical protein CIW52_17430 [Mycolicibacterium sp. P9-64]|uniref:hypothetical protein n=1 Tax=Mycolicibacterium sp. P9-64 TaxID=2024612 RepID=UPI0011EEDAFC|nr:hypothetical protein [Mycolicibacterium sp. P9-64]KAA0082718.1 hypothetical protein CIW52_17430 [Mycolicibacterium sp. P9-64]